MTDYLSGALRFGYRDTDTHQETLCWLASSLRLGDVGATDGWGALTQGRQEVLGRLQICRVQAFHERLDYRL